MFVGMLYSIAFIQLPIFGFHLMHFFFKYHDTSDQKVDVAANLLGCEENEKNQLAENFEAKILAMDSEENEESQRTLGTRGTNSIQLPLIQDEELD